MVKYLENSDELLHRLLGRSDLSCFEGEIKSGKGDLNISIFFMCGNLWQNFPLSDLDNVLPFGVWH